MSGKEASVSNINETEKSGKAITETEFSSCFNFSKKPPGIIMLTQTLHPSLLEHMMV